MLIACGTSLSRPLRLYMFFPFLFPFPFSLFGFTCRLFVVRYRHGHYDWIWFYSFHFSFPFFFSFFLFLFSFFPFWSFGPYADRLSNVIVAATNSFLPVSFFPFFFFLSFFSFFFYRFRLYADYLRYLVVQAITTRCENFLVLLLFPSFSSDRLGFWTLIACGSWYIIVTAITAGYGVAPPFFSLFCSFYFTALDCTPIACDTFIVTATTTGFLNFLFIFFFLLPLWIVWRLLVVHYGHEPLRFWKSYPCPSSKKREHKRKKRKNRLFG